MKILSLPPATTSAAPPPIPKEEADAILAALKPKRPRPLIAIVIAMQLEYPGQWNDQPPR